MKSTFLLNNKIFFFQASIICALISFLIPISSLHFGFYVLSLISLVEVCLFCICSIRQNGGQLSYACMYVIILYVFHFGQVLLLGLFSSHLTDVRIVLTYFSDKENYIGLRVMNYAFLCICNGILIKSTGNVQSLNQIVVPLASLNKNRIIAKKIIFYLFPIKFFIDMLFVYNAFTVGFTYAVHWLSAFPDILKTVGDFSLVGFALLLISYKGDKKKQLKLFVLIIAYFLLLMSSGRRSENVAYIAVFLFLFMRTYGKIRWKSIIIYSFLCFCLLAVLSTVRNLRNDGRDFASLVQGFLDVFTDPRMLIDILREYGDTGYTAMCTLFLWLPRHGPSWGSSYYLGITAIFPNIGGVMGELSTKSAYALTIQQSGAVFTEYYNIGGSLLGELFFNFGALGGIIAAFPLGLIIGSFFNKVELALRRNDYIRLVIYFLVVTNLTYWVRDTFVGGIRPAVWGVLFFNFLFYKIFKLKKYK